MTHELATATLHDGGGLFTLAWSLVVIPLSLATVFNYRGMAARMKWRGGRPMSLLAARIFGGVFFAGGLLTIGLAIHRFALGGY